MKTCTVTIEHGGVKYLRQAQLTQDEIQDLLQLAGGLHNQRKIDRVRIEPAGSGNGCCNGYKEAREFIASFVNTIPAHMARRRMVS